MSIKNRTYYPLLDGLRGLAILLVLFHHNFKFSNFFFFGWIGVDLFFVISGFLITDILLTTLHDQHYLKNFYIRRVLRIFPVYYLGLILCLFVLPQIPGLVFDMSFYHHFQVYLWTYTQNWLFIFHEPITNQSLLHTWSLGVEEQFYLIWPILVLILRTPKNLLYFSLSFLILINLIRFEIWDLKLESLPYSSFFTFTRIDGLCVGAATIALNKIYPDFLKQNFGFLVLFLGLVNIGFYFINNVQNFALPYLAFVGYSTFAILFGLLVYASARNESKILKWIFDNSIFRFFGRLSYGLYVYHWPINVLLFSNITHALSRNFSPFTSQALSGIAVSLIGIFVSYLSFYYFEKPILGLKAKYS